MVLLVGEIDGKSTRLALFTHKSVQKKDGERFSYAVDEMVCSCSFGYDGYSHEKDNGIAILQNLLDTFLKNHYYGQEIEKHDIYGACFSVAGTVQHGTAEVDRKNFKAKFTKRDIAVKFPSKSKSVPVSFINDMEAIGYSIFLGDGENQLDDLCNVNVSQSDLSKERRALMLVSEGMGQALWYWDGQHGKNGAFRPIPSEGGHGDFADPTPDKELSIYLEKTNLANGDTSSISYEQVLSEDGLLRIYEFLKSTRQYPEENEGEIQNISSEVIIEKAFQAKHIPLCKASVELFVRIWGAEAGNLALRYTAIGGVYIGGNLPIPTDKLREYGFEKAFVNKEKTFGNYNSNIPVKVFSIYNNPDILLWGAARYAIFDGYVSKGKFAIERAKQ